MTPIMKVPRTALNRSISSKRLGSATAKTYERRTGIRKLVAPLTEDCSGYFCGGYRCLLWALPMIERALQ